MFVYVLNYLNIFNAVPQNSPRMHSPQQNKKAVLTSAAYFSIVSTLVRSQRQYSRFVYLCLPKSIFQYKTEKVNTTSEFRIFELV